MRRFPCTSFAASRLAIFAVFSLGTLAGPSGAKAQADDATSYTLGSGKVLHFASADAKAKFLASREKRQTQPAAAAPPGHEPANTVKSADKLSIGMHATPRAGSGAYTLDDYGIGLNFQQMAGLDVEVKNYGSQSADLEAFCIFFGRRLSDNSRIVVGITREKVAVEAGGEKKFEVRSPKINTTDYSSLRGARYEGWLMELHKNGGGEAIAYAGSTSFLEELGPRPELTAMLDEFSERHGRK